MAKLKAPLMSLGASQQLGKALVFFGWKGLDVVREYVIPSNPRSAGQTTQRGYLTAGVAELHRIQGLGVGIWTEADQIAYALWASVVKAATTWFNQVMKNWLDQNVAGLWGVIYCTISATPGIGSVTVDVTCGANAPAAGDWYYGTSKTNMPNSQASIPAAGFYPATIAGLVAGVKYYFQFRATAVAGVVGTRSGIIHATPL